MCESRMQWVSVEERLPVHEDRYLVALEVDIDSSYIYLVSFRPPCFWGSLGAHYKHITHWMPLPDLPLPFIDLPEDCEMAKAVARAVARENGTNANTRALKGAKFTVTTALSRLHGAEENIESVQDDVKEAREYCDIALERINQLLADIEEERLEALLEPSEVSAAERKGDQGAAKTNKTIVQRALDWLLFGNTSGASKALCAAMLGLARVKERPFCGSVPLDKPDFGRCLQLLALIPEWREELDKVAEALPNWTAFIANWGSLEEEYQQVRPAAFYMLLDPCKIQAHAQSADTRPLSDEECSWRLEEGTCQE